MNKPNIKLKESTDWRDLYRMQTEFALYESMRKSKTLTAIVLISVTLFMGFGVFLFKMAGVN